MNPKADVVSSSRLLTSLNEALPRLRRAAEFESAETIGTGELINKLETALPAIRAEQESPGVMVTFRDPTSSQLQSFIASQPATFSAAEAGGMEAKFDSNDIFGWFGSFFTWWKKIHPYPWQTASADPEPFPNVARVALLADWGTALYGALPCAQSIANDKAGFQLVMHLGDVYYSGDDGEMDSRFLNVWPKVTGALSRGLNGNHEMYTGGQAYFSKALKQFGQQASYFALQNDYWLLIGLDSAYADQDLNGDQATWLQSLVNKAGSRQIVLFSHHQPFSILDTPAAAMVAKLAPILESKRIYAWYFGHEHRCLVYEPHAKWGLLGRCIGHSGFPEFRKAAQWGPPPATPTWRSLSGGAETPSALLLDGRNEYIKNHEDEYGPHGYVTLEFEGAKLTETFHMPDGTKVEISKTAQAAQGTA